MAELSELDRRLQELAQKNWWQFVRLIGQDEINNAKACILRGDGLSYNQIKNKLGLTRNQAQYNCGKCDLPTEPAA